MSNNLMNPRIVVSLTALVPLLALGCGAPTEPRDAHITYDMSADVKSFSRAGWGPISVGASSIEGTLTLTVPSEDANKSLSGLVGSSFAADLSLQFYACEDTTCSTHDMSFSHKLPLPPSDSVRLDTIQNGGNGFIGAFDFVGKVAGDSISGAFVWDTRASPASGYSGTFVLRRHHQ